MYWTGAVDGKMKEEVQDWLPEDMDCVPLEVYKEVFWW